MSQAESLRMTAEVVDRFTGPLGNLRKQMESLSREGGVHTDTLTKGFGRMESGAQAAEKAISSGLKPALGVVGITGLSAAAAITGVAAAMRNFAAGAASLGVLSRETGQTAENLRNFGAVASKFGIDQDAMAAGTKNFAGQMREFGRGIGETYQWLNRQGRDEAGRKHFQDFAADLRNTTDRGEQLRKVLGEMENIKDPTERGMFAEKFFGSADFGRLGDKHFGPILEMWKKTAQKLGPLDPAAVKSAEDFERTMSELRTSMQKLGTTVGQEVLPYASQFTTWLSDIVGGQRNDAIKALRDGIGEIRKEVDAIDWKGAGAQAKEFLTGTITFAGDLVKALKAAALLLGALKDLKDGNVGEAFKKLGAADSATDLGLGKGRAPGTIQDSMRADTGPLMLRQAELQRQIAIAEENISRKESQPDALGEGRVTDTEGRARRDRLIDETRKLADEIRRLREDPAKKAPGEAVAQPSAFGGGTGLGGLIHRASLGGLAGAARAGQFLGGGNGIVAPGGGYSSGGDRLFGRDPVGGGPTRPESGAEQSGRALRGGAGDGRMNARAAEGSGRYRPEYKLGDADIDQRVVNTIAGEVSTKNGEGVDAVINNMLNRVGTKGWGPSKNLLDVARAPGQYAGYRRAAAGESEFIRSRIRAIASGGVPDNTNGSNSYRAESYYRGAGRNRTWARTSDIGPNVGGNRYGFVRGAPNGPYAPYADGPLSQAEADGSGFSADFKARQENEDQRRESMKLGPAGRSALQGALRGGTAGATQNTDRNLIDLRVHNPGPNTHVTTDAKGPLFREIQQTRGRQMQPAGEGA